MKSLLRNFLINLAALWVATFILPGFVVEGGVRTFLLGALALMLINIAVVPLLKIMFLPLNLITLGFFTWVINVIGLYILTKIIPQIKLLPYFFPGADLGGVTFPAMQLNILHVAILASFLVGFTSHFLVWLTKSH
jgi:putative membrane protein